MIRHPHLGGCLRVSLARLRQWDVEKCQKGMQRLLTIVDVFILFVCNILELLVSRVSRNDKVYELDTALNRTRQRENTGTHLSSGGLSTFIHPPARKNRILDVRQIEEIMWSTR